MLNHRRFMVLRFSRSMGDVPVIVIDIAMASVRPGRDCLKRTALPDHREQLIRRTLGNLPGTKATPFGTPFLCSAFCRLSVNL